MMAVVTIIDDEMRTLVFHEESRIVHHKIKKRLLEGAFQDMLSKGADYLEKYRATKWLSDDRDNIVISPEENEWGDKVWAPRVIKAGFKYWAVVIPSSAVGQLQMRRFIEEYRGRGVIVEIFDDVQTALSWLESKS